MSRVLKRILIGLGVFIVLVVIAIAIFLPPTRRKSYPQIDGEITLPGLDAPVDIYRDAMGIPHVYATTEHDLFFAQGFLQAQDRFWQMDFQRHLSTGRLSELLGSVMLDTDMFLQTLGWERVARAELELLDDATIAVLEAYSEGVNAYLAEYEGSEISLEYVFLPILNRGYEPDAWEPLFSLSLPKAMAWQLASNMDDEIERALLLDTINQQQLDDIIPPYPSDGPVIVNDQSPFSGEISATYGYSSTQLAAVNSLLETVGQRVAALDALVGGGGESMVGSNSWAISGELSATGDAMLANDPHLEHSIPHIWHQIGLHCAPIGPDCNIELQGYSLLGAPGIVIGHNDRIAWGLTNVGADVMDLYIEKLNPDNPDQYEVNGDWVDMDIITETLNVGGDELVDVRVRITRHGPIISDVYGDLEDFSEEAGIDLPENYAIALRWTALEPSFTLKAILGFNRAQNWEEFREAARDFAVPAQNLLYADVDGNIAYQMPGMIPIRTSGDGRLPVPGWTDEYEWEGFIPFDNLPFVLNPPEGYIVTANNPVVDETYPFHITDVWAYPNRAQRIVDMIEQAPGLIDRAYFQQMQYDNKDLTAEAIVPYLMQITVDDEGLEEARALLNGWDFQMDIDSPAAAMYAAFWKHLLAATFQDELPEDSWPGGSARWLYVLYGLLDEPSNAWWDDQNTEASESRDAIFLQALEAAVDDLEDRLGRDPTDWAWGELHVINYAHGVMDNLPLINSIFNRGPFAIAGGPSIVNATSWNASAEDYSLSSGSPSMRMIVDLGNLQNSLTIYPAGQSGHAGHEHYIDMAGLWRLGQYVPMHWERSAIEADTEGYLRLVP